MNAYEKKEFDGQETGEKDNEECLLVRKNNAL